MIKYYYLTDNGTLTGTITPDQNDQFNISQNFRIGVLSSDAVQCYTQATNSI